MGFSLKKAFKSVSKPIKKLKKPLKKVGSIAVSTAGGFIGGGAVGALAGTVKGIAVNTQTSKAASITLGSVGTDVAIGGATNIAAGALAAGGAKLAAGGVGKGLIGKAVAFGKTGGIAGNLGNLTRGFGNVIKKGIGVLSATDLFKKGAGVVPGDDQSVDEVEQDQETLGDKITESYRRIKDNVPRLKSFATSIRENGVSQEAVEDLKSIIIGRDNQPTPQSTPIIVGGEGPQMNLPLLAGAGLLLFFLVKKR